MPCGAWCEPSVTALARGVVVETVEPGSALAKAGITAGDTIVSWQLRDADTHLGGDVIDTAVTFSLTEAAIGPRSGVVIVVVRGSRTIELQVPPLQWRTQVRPQLDVSTLQRYELAAAALKARRWDEAAAAFEGLAIASSNALRIEDALWFYEKAAGAKRAQQKFDAASALTDRAVRLAEASTLRLAASWVLQNAGADLWRSGQHAQSEARISAALRIRESVGAPPLLIAQSLGSLALLTGSHSEYARAREYADRMLAIAQSEAPQSLAEAEAHHQLGNIAHWSDDLDAALAHHQRALMLRARIDPSGLTEARSHGAVGNILWRRGELTLAQECYQMALAIIERLEPGGSLAGQVLISLGYIAQDQRDLVAAERYQSQALALYERIAPNAEQVANIRNALGQIQRLRGELPAARMLTEQALAQYRRIAPGGLQESLALANLGAIALDLGDFALARQYQLASLELARRLTPNGPRVGERLLSLARIDIENHALDAAEQNAADALEILQRVAPGGLAVVEALTVLGRIRAEGADAALARQHLQRAVSMAARMTPGTLWEAEPYYYRARLERRVGDTAAALGMFASALAALEAQRALFGGSDEARAGFSQRYADYYRDYIELLLESNRAEDAFSISERYRARALLDAATSRRAAAARLPRDLADARERATYRYESALKRVREYALSKSSAKTFEQEVQALQDARIQLLLAEGRISALPGPQGPAELTEPWSARDLRAQLTVDTAILSYVETANGMHLLTLDGTRTAPRAAVRAVRVARDVAQLRGEIESLAVLLRTHVQTPDSDAALFERLADLYARLIAPVEDVLRGKRRLIIVADGPLHRVAWSALIRHRERTAGRPTRARFLVDDFTVLVEPSATFFVRTANAGSRTKPGPAHVVAFAATGYSENVNTSMLPAASESRSMVGDAMGSLPWAAAEVAAIKTTFGKFASVFTGTLATETKVKQLASSATVLHFAAHSVASESSPLDSFIALAPERAGNPGGDNGMLYAWEVMADLRLSSPLVVLSACETGGGRETAAEGILGLTRAFHYAGARGVVSSLWPVSDRATTALMKKFYEGLAAGEPADAALRNAQLHLLHAEDPSWLERTFRSEPLARRAWRHPFYWAGFQLSGNAQ